MKKVGIFLADGFEEIEGLTSVDAMRRAGYEVTTISIMDKKLITGSHNIRVYADMMFDDVDIDGFDAIVLPGGGVGTENLLKHEGVKNAVKRYNEAGKIIGAICAAPIVLSEAGVLDGLHATCYPGCQERFSDKVIYTGVQVDQEKNIVTGNGMGAALPFALALVMAISGEEDVAKVKEGVAWTA